MTVRTMCDTILSIRHNTICPGDTTDNPRMAILILPLVSLEEQMEEKMRRFGVHFISLTRTGPGKLKHDIKETKPHIVVTNVEVLDNPTTQCIISQISLSYISVDEAQVTI